jgi:hypothetical protein
MKTINWFTELGDLFRNNKNIDELIMSEELFPFMGFVNLPPPETFVLAAIGSSPRRSKGLKISDVITNCSKALPKETIQNAFEELINNGWLYTSREDFPGAEEKVFIKPQIELAFKFNNSNELPKYNLNDKAQEIRQMALKAASFRRGFISLNDWKIFCDDFFKRKRLIKKIQECGIKNNYKEARYFLTFVMALSIYENAPVNIDTVHRLFSKDQIDRFFWVQKFMSEKSPLIQNSLILTHEQYGIDQLYSVGEQWLRLFVPTASLMSEKKAIKLLSRISAKSISPIELIFNAENKLVLNSIETLLNEKKFAEYVSKMESQNLLAGLTVLLSGHPGTGKTEYCRQLAKKTNRDILFFEVAKARSKWYGETERNIKQVFDEYRYFCSGMKHKPILLFNEADSIFSARGSNKTSIGQVENVVQTILLNELEQFEGILIATTNRPETFDKAFLRRFHYQIDLLEPAIDSKISLLEQIFPQLSTSICNNFSVNFDFTGADLLNIRKKLVIHEVINHNIALEEFIEEELQSMPRNKTQCTSKIGFLKT